MQPIVKRLVQRWSMRLTQRCSVHVSVSRWFHGCLLWKQLSRSMHLIPLLIVLVYLLRYQRMCFESLVRSQVIFHCHFSSLFLLSSVWVVELVMIWSMLTLVSVPIGYFVRNATPRVFRSRWQVHQFWWAPVNVSSTLSWKILESIVPPR